jgi:hypothetical protein
VLDVGRKQRFFRGATRRAIEVRDQRCTDEFCDKPAEECEADHIVPYGQGGETTVANGRLRCGYHNRRRNHHPDNDQPTLPGITDTDDDEDVEYDEYDLDDDGYEPEDDLDDESEPDVEEDGGGDGEVEPSQPHGLVETDPVSTNAPAPHDDVAVDTTETTAGAATTAAEADDVESTDEADRLVETDPVSTNEGHHTEPNDDDDV